MNRYPRRLADHLNSSATLHELLEKSRKHAVLLQKVREIVPSPLNAHCVAALQKASQLLIYVDASVWASRLRFCSRQLIAPLQKSGLQVDKVTVRVLVRSQRKPPLRAPIRHLSRDNANLIQQTAEGLDDVALSSALKRLVKHAR